MDNRTVAIGIGILVIVLLGFLFFSNITGNVINGSAIQHETIENHYFKISDSGNKTIGEGNINGTQNNSKS